MIIPIINPTTTLEEKTWLTANYSSGTSLSVMSSSGYSDNDLILVGYPGQERTEITDLTATPPSTTSLTVTALDFSHHKDTPVHKLLFDQAEIHRSTNSGTSYSLLATVSLTYDKLITPYDDSSGDTTYLYKIRLKNSITANISNFSDVQTGVGWPRNSVGRMVRNIRRYLGDLDNRKFKDWEIMEEIKNGSVEVLSEIPNAFWTLRSDPRTTTASTNEYSLPTDYRAMLYLIYTYSTSSVYPLKYEPKLKHLANSSDPSADDNDELDSWTETPGDDTYPNGYFQVYPTPESASKSMELWYYRDEPSFDSYGDITSCPMPQVYEHYAVANLTDNTDIMAKHESIYARGLRQLKQRQRRTMSPKSLRQWMGRDGLNTMFGRAIRRTEEDVENYW